MDGINLLSSRRPKYYLLYFVPSVHITDKFLCDADYDADNISNFIASYTLSIPNLAVRNFS